MARIVSKSRKKPDIVVTPSNTSKTASLVNEVFNDFFITDHTPDSISLNGNLFTLILSNKKFVFQEIKLDKDKDGDIDGKDFAMLRKKKKGEKSEVKPRQEPDTEKGKGDAPMEKKESTRWPVYARIMEKATHKGGATAPEEMDSKDSPSAKKMKADHKPEVKDNPEASGDDVKKASNSAPAMKARGNDNMKGDKAIVNPVKGAVTS